MEAAPTSDSTSELRNEAYQGDTLRPVFPHSNPPFLALITEADSCESDDKLQAALTALHAAVSTHAVDLVSVRIDSMCETSRYYTPYKKRLETILVQLVKWSNASSSQFRVVVSSNWWSVGLCAGAHGVHFKEAHQDQIESARLYYRTLHPQGDLLVGTSTHSVESAVTAFVAHRPDYLFAGTCFTTLSHPEKALDDLEGPTLPALVVQALNAHQERPGRDRPVVLAIGGLDETNCQAQVTLGAYIPNAQADGIATIRAVLCANNPFQSVQTIRQRLADGWSSVE